MMDDKKSGWACLVAFVGGGIAFLTMILGVMGWLEEATYEHWGAAQTYFLVAFFGGTIGLTLFIVGMVMAFSEGKEQSSSPDSLEKRPPEEHLCRNCGSQLVGNPKACKWCGADLK